MQRPSLPPDPHVITAAVNIDRPVAEVFDFYRDLRNLPRFLGDVLDVRKLEPTTYRWTIAGPLASRTHWVVRITSERPDLLLSYETVGASAWKTRWEVHFNSGPDPRQTVVREIMTMPLGTLGRLGLALIGKFPAAEMQSNLRRLKQLLETGKVTDFSHAVPGKFLRTLNGARSRRRFRP